MKYGYFVRSVLRYFEIRDLTLKVERLGFDSAQWKYNSIGSLYMGYSEDVKEEMDNLEALGIDKMMLWGVQKSKQSEAIKDPLETFANKIMK